MSRFLTCKKEKENQTSAEGYYFFKALGELRLVLTISINKDSKKQKWLKLQFIEIKRQCSKEKELKRKNYLR